MRATGFPVSGSGAVLGFQSLEISRLAQNHSHVFWGERGGFDAREFPPQIRTQADAKGAAWWKPDVVLFYDTRRKCYAQRGGGMMATCAQVARHWGRFFVEAVA